MSWYHYRDFVDEFPETAPVAEQVFVVDRDRITCGGGSGVADLAAFLIERHLGPAVAQKAMHILMVSEPRAAEAAQPQPPVPGGAGNPHVTRALLLMEQHLCAPLPMSVIAGRVGIGARQLERLFLAGTGMKPAECYRAMRLRYANWLLRNSRRSITDIAVAAGVAEGAHFSRVFRKAYGAAPSHLREAGDAAPGVAAEGERRIFD